MSVEVWRYVVPPDSANGGGWGIFLLDSSGMFAVVSDFGNYAFKWTSFGQCFRSFVTKLDPGYLCGKLGRRVVYDEDKTRKLVREHILSHRRERSMTRDEARQEWDLTHDMEDFRTWYEQTLLDSAYEFCSQSFPGELVGFAERLYPRFCEAVAAQLRAERIERIDDAAKTLAAEHMADDPEMLCVLRLPDEHEVRLVEIATSAPVTGEVLPFRFRPDPPDVPFSYLVVLLHPDDWDNRHHLEWPPGLDPSVHELVAGSTPDEREPSKPRVMSADDDAAERLLAEIERLKGWLSHIEGGDYPCLDEAKLRQWAYEAVTLGRPAPGGEG